MLSKEQKIFLGLALIIEGERSFIFSKTVKLIKGLSGHIYEGAGSQGHSSGHLFIPKQLFYGVSQVLKND